MNKENLVQMTIDLLEINWKKLNNTESMYLFDRKTETEYFSPKAQELFDEIFDYLQNTLDLNHL